MTYDFNNSLIKRLEEGKTTKIIIITDSAYQENINKKNYNILVEILPEESIYTKLNNKIPSDTDLIILCTEKTFNLNKLATLKYLISQISKNSGKRVSLCYSFLTYKDTPRELIVASVAKIVSVKDDTMYEDSLLLGKLVTDPFYLADITAKLHDDLEDGNIKITDATKKKKVKVSERKTRSTK